MAETIRRLWIFARWLWWAGVRYRHFSLTCYGELPCDPRAHMPFTSIWELSGVMASSGTEGRA